MLTILGINNDQETCQCCGRKELKRVVWLGDEEGNIKGHYGTTCAANMLNLQGSKAQIRHQLNNKALEDKRQFRINFFQNNCIPVSYASGTIFIENKYKIGLVMKKLQLTRNEAINHIKEQMNTEYWFLQ